MKTLGGFLLCALIISGCECFREATIPDEEFTSDLASENNRIAGTLILDVYPQGLDSLTYAGYLEFLREHEAPSTQGLSMRIGKADEHLFKTKQSAFLLVLYYRAAKVIVGDNSTTSLIDTVIHVPRTSEPPSLEEVATKLGF
jgi:hypothetical protein